MASYRRLEHKPKPANEDPGDLQVGFDYIREFSPRSNMGNGQTEWAQIASCRLGGPLHGRSAGLVKECLRNHSASNVYARPVTSLFLTLHDVAAWPFDDVLVEILGDHKSHTLSRNCSHPSVSLRPWTSCEVKPASKNVRSPDILGGPDTSVVSMTKLKAFLHSTLTETHTHTNTVERWTTSKFDSGLC